MNEEKQQRRASSPTPAGGYALTRGGRRGSGMEPRPSSRLESATPSLVRFEPRSNRARTHPWERKTSAACSTPGPVRRESQSPTHPRSSSFHRRRRKSRRGRGGTDQHSPATAERGTPRRAALDSVARLLLLRNRGHSGDGGRLPASILSCLLAGRGGKWWLLCKNLLRCECDGRPGHKTTKLPVRSSGSGAILYIRFVFVLFHLI